VGVYESGRLDEKRPNKYSRTLLVVRVKGVCEVGS
jgi:hypothetical protein